MSVNENTSLKKVRTFFDDAATLRPETKETDIHKAAEQKAPTPPSPQTETTKSEATPVKSTVAKTAAAALTDTNQSLPTAAAFLDSHIETSQTANQTLPTPPKPSASNKAAAAPTDSDTETTFENINVDTSKITKNEPPEFSSLEADLAAEFSDSKQTFKTDNLPVAEDDLNTGVIISDKKRVGFNPFRATADGIKNSWQKTKAKLTKDTETSVQTTNSESRLKTLQSAAQGSFNAPQDDYVSLQKKLKAQKAEPTTPSNPLQVKDASEVAAPSWSHTVGSPNQDSENLPKQPSSTTPTSDKAAENVSPPPTTVKTEAPKADKAEATALATNVSQPKPSTEDTQVLPNPEISIPAVTETPDDANSAKPSSHNPISTTLPTAKASPWKNVSQSEARDNSPVTPKSQPSSQSTATPFVSRLLGSRYTVVIIIFLALGLGTGTAVYWFGTPAPSNTIPSYSIPTIVNTDKQIPVPLNSNEERFLDILTKNLTAYNELVQFYPTASGASVAPIPATTAEVIAALALQTPGNFSRNVESLMFGSTADSEPFLVFKVQDFDTAFAGMLSWEQYISADLEPWFGPAVLQTFDVDARTDTQLRTAFFTDAAIANTSVRILRDENKNERIVYGFVSPNIILITTTNEAFRKIRERI